MSNPNWRPNWLERWGYKIPPLEPIEPSDRQLLAEKLAQKEARERVEKALEADVDMTEETKQDIEAIMMEAQAEVGFAPNSPKLSLVPAKPQAISRLKRLFLKKS